MVLLWAHCISGCVYVSFFFCMLCTHMWLFIATFLCKWRCMRVCSCVMIVFYDSMYNICVDGLSNVSCSTLIGGPCSRVCVSTVTWFNNLCLRWFLNNNDKNIYNNLKTVCLVNCALQIINFDKSNEYNICIVNEVHYNMYLKEFLLWIVFYLFKSILLVQ